MPQKIYWFFQKICKQNKVFPKQVLELMCGDGEVLQCFADQSSIYGIESSKAKFQKLKETITVWKFYNQKFGNFRIPFQGQLIYCVYSAFNQLTKYTDREKVFSKVVWHLEPYGLFVFRVNTEKYYQWFVDQIEVKQTEKNYIITQTKKSKNNVYNFEVAKFIYKENDMYTLFKSSESEVSFPVSQIKKSLQQYFEKIEILDLKWKRSSVSHKEVYFVCQKGWE